MSVVNVEEYLKRIKYSGSSEPNLENLNKFCEHQAKNIPFDSLNLFGGPGKKFDLNAIYRVIVKEKRGGFCCELNSIFGEFLREFGYDVSYIEGSVYEGIKLDSFAAPFDHMILKVKLDNEIWIIDVGYGGTPFYLPKKLECMIEQSDSIGTYRFREMPGTKDEYIFEKCSKKLSYIKSGKERMENKEASPLYNGTVDWKIIWKLSIKEHSWEEFEVGWNENIESQINFVMNNSLLKLYNDTGVSMLWGYKYIERTFKDEFMDTMEVTDLPHETPEDLQLLQ